MASGEHVDWWLDRVVNQILLGVFFPTMPQMALWPFNFPVRESIMEVLMFVYLQRVSDLC